MKSKFKIRVIFVLFFLSITMFPLLYFGIFSIIQEKGLGLSEIITFSFITICIILSLFLFLKDIMFISIYSNEIKFKYFFPLLNKSYNWSDFDYGILTDESGKYSQSEVIYLIKNKKVIKVVSSQYYKNYQELKSEIFEYLEFKGKLNMDFFSQFTLRLGMRQNKLP